MNQEVTTLPDRSRRRARHRLIQRSIGLSIGAAALLLPAVAAHADSGHGVEFKFNGAFADFTDCPLPDPAGFSEAGDCLATAINANRNNNEVLGSETQSAIVYVTLFAVHYGPDVPGGFTFSPIADGSANGKIKNNGLRSATAKASVPLSDGTTVTVRIALNGTGATTVQKGTFTAAVAECPSGSAQMSYRSSSRNAVATGQVIAHGTIETATSAVASPQLFQETDEGSCTS